MSYLVLSNRKITTGVSVPQLVTLSAPQTDVQPNAREGVSEDRKAVYGFCVFAGINLLETIDFELRILLTTLIIVIGNIVNRSASKKITFVSGRFLITKASQHREYSVC